jgi:hypothetical protein
MLIVAAVLAVIGAGFGIAALVALRRPRLIALALNVLASALVLSLAGLVATISVATRGYRGLTSEELAAEIETIPSGPQSFRAAFRFPDGRRDTFNLAGDEIYVDAHILKWKPLANILGLRTAYELDRVGGRYLRLDHEQARPRTIFPLSRRKPVDMFELRRRFPPLTPLVDAEYGSGTFVLATEPSRLEVRVSTTGLLIRRVGGE